MFKSSGHRISSASSFPKSSDQRPAISPEELVIDETKLSNLPDTDNTEIVFSETAGWVEEKKKLAKTQKKTIADLMKVKKYIFQMALTDIVEK